MISEVHFEVNAGRERISDALRDTSEKRGFIDSHAYSIARSLARQGIVLDVKTASQVGADLVSDIYDRVSPARDQDVAAINQLEVRTQ